MRRRASGMTLVEILIAMAIFGVFMTIAANTLVRCYSNYINNRNAVSLFRDATVAFNKMQRELSECQQIYAPDPSGGTFSEGQTMSPCLATPFVFGFQEPDLAAGVVGLNGIGPPPPMLAVGYLLDKNVFERLVYAQGADPTTSSPVLVQRLADPVATFTVTHQGRGNNHNALAISANATVQMKVRTLAIFFQTRVLGMKAGI